MEITGRLTANAMVNTTRNNKEVVNFSVAVNDRFKNKEGDITTKTEFFNCAFWRGSNVAKALTKGTIVSLSGWASVNAWIGADGEAKAALNFFTSDIKILGGGKKQEEAEQTTDTGARTGSRKNQNKKKSNASQNDDDLPF